MKKKLLALLLVAAMVLTTVLAGCAKKPANYNNPSTTGKPDDNTPVAGKVILGSITELGGDFRFPGFDGSNPAASDVDINTLTVGYSTMEMDKNGEYQWNQVVVKSHKEETVENEDGTTDYVITIEINPGLKFSDGTEIKAVNYVAYVLAFSSRVVAGAGAPGMAGMSYVGYEPFSYYVGEGKQAYLVIPNREDPEAEPTYEPVDSVNTFEGVRLIDDYTFALTIDGPDYYPYYYVETYGAVTPYPLDLILGDGVEIKDDGEGCYLSESWYEWEKDTNEKDPAFVKSNHVIEARYDTTKYAFSGPYVITKWDEQTRQCELEVNTNYAGNWEGQKPHIQTVVYVKVVPETQFDQLANGEVDLLMGLTGGDDVNQGLELVEKGGFKETHYNRSGYGKLQFDCDFSPTMFTEVRQAIAYVLDRDDFASTFTGGYGATVNGPFSVNMWMYQEAIKRDDWKLSDYAYSIANAKKALEDGGWVYNSKGEAFVEGQSGVDSVRYKKLTAEEATAENKAFQTVSNEDGITYRTVEINGEYYMPLAINWFSTENNPVSDLLVTKLMNAQALKEIGMVIRQTIGTFTAMTNEISREGNTYDAHGGTPVYSMYNLATSWSSSIYDYSYNWMWDPAFFAYSVNKYYDPYDLDFPYYDEEGNHTKLSYADAVEKSGGKLGMDYMSFAMVYDATTREEYLDWWVAYILRWNEIVPDIPLYGNIYYDVYNDKIQGLSTGPYFGPAAAMVYCTVSE